MQRDRDLAEVRAAEEPEGRLLGVVHLVPAGLAVGDDALESLEAAVQEVHALAADRQPSAAVDPVAPVVEAGDHGSPGVVDGGRQFAELLDREGVGLRVQETEVDVRSRQRAPARARPAEHDRHHAADGGEALDQGRDHRVLGL